MWWSWRFNTYKYVAHTDYIKHTSNTLVDLNKCVIIHVNVFPHSFICTWLFQKVNNTGCVPGWYLLGTQCKIFWHFPQLQAQLSFCDNNLKKQLGNFHQPTLTLLMNFSKSMTLERIMQAIHTHFQKSKHQPRPDPSEAQTTVAFQSYYDINVREILRTAKILQRP